MPLKDGRFTKKEQEFITAYIETGFRREMAETLAGYAKNSAYQVLNRPDVQAEINRRIEADLASGEAKGLVWIHKKLDDEATPDSTMMKIIEYIGKRRSSLSAGDAGREKEAHEMTSDEIAAKLAELEGVAAGRATPIEDKRDDQAESPFD